MPIVNQEKLLKHISNWIREYCLKYGLKSLIFNYDYSPESKLLYHLTKKTNLKVLPIHFPLEFELKEKDQYLPSDVKIIDINDQASFINKIFDNRLVHKTHWNLTSAILPLFAKEDKGIILGLLNRNFHNLVRNFNKYENGNVDLLPLADLFRSEILELLQYLNDDYKDFFITSLDLTQNEVEWADRENMKTKIIQSNIDPTKHPSWLGYTAHQRIIISKVYQLEKDTQHKIRTDIPICKIRNIEGLVR